MAEVLANAPIVLIVDPDRLFQQQLAQSLGTRFRVLLAGTMGEAARLIVTYRPAIMLLELDLPDGDGKQLIRQTLSYPATSQMIIACVTRRNGVRDKIEGFQAGARDYVVKPVNLESFVYRVLLLPKTRA